MTPWTAAHQASLSITNSQSLLKLMSIESVMLSHHVILCRPLLLLHLIFPSIRVFSSEWVLHIRWPKCMSFSFSISPSNDIQDWYHSWLSGFIFLQSKELSERKKERKKSRKQNSCQLFMAEHDTPSVILSQKCSCGEGGGWGGLGWGIHVNPWLIHVNVWQKPLQYCKVISLQLIKKKKRSVVLGGGLVKCLLPQGVALIWWEVY